MCSLTPLFEDGEIERLSAQDWKAVSEDWGIACNKRGINRHNAITRVGEYFRSRLDGVRTEMEIMVNRLKAEIVKNEERHPLYEQKERLFESLARAHEANMKHVHKIKSLTSKEDFDAHMDTVLQHWKPLDWFRIEKMNRETARNEQSPE